MAWAGDQNVDWSEDDGLISVIPAALSLAVCGMGLHHSDMGGYTTLFGMKRTRELFQRWVELSAFTPLMRSHEGNRPGDNWQFDSDDETLDHLARLGQLFQALAPYRRRLIAENAATGIAVMRPLFWEFEGDEACWAIKDQFMLGADLLVAPVVREGYRSRKVYLPAGDWVQLGTRKRFARGSGEGGTYTVLAPIGRIPVFARADSSELEVFLKAGELLS
jgi:alpha-glucosidase